MEVLYRIIYHYYYEKAVILLLLLPEMSQMFAISLGLCHTVMLQCFYEQFILIISSYFTISQSQRKKQYCSVTSGLSYYVTI